MTITVFVCPRCGTIGKSDKMSCCGRGGSWFKNCGGAGNTKLQHTWHEGIQACKARSQSKKGIGYQLSVAQQKDIDSSPSAYIVSNYKAVIAASKTFLFTSPKTSTPILDTTPIDVSTYTPEHVMITVSARTLMTNPSTHSLMTSSNHTSESTSIITQLFISIFCLSLIVF